MNLLLLALHFSLASASAMDHTVSTSGQCSREVTPDRASIVFTVEKLNRDVKMATSAATELHEKLRKELKKTNAKDLELTTTEYSVYEKKDFQKNKSVSLGFAARLGVKASTSEVADTSKLIAAAANLGITETGELVSYLSEEKSRDEQKKCLATAAQNAREKADALAKSLGSTLGKTLQINERGANVPGPQPMREMMAFGRMNKMMDSGPTIDAGKQTIHQDVDVTFAIEP
jgi:uncharacterized protein YggE